MKSLLVALDDTPGAAAAVARAQALAVKHGAKLTGVSVLDIAQLTTPPPLLDGRYGAKANIAGVMAAHDRNSQLLRDFMTECRKRNIQCDIAALQGAAVEELRGAAAEHDAIVIGHDSDLRGETSGGPAATVDLLLKHNPRPLIVTPAGAVDASRFVVAYDDSAPASRAVQLIALLNVAVGAKVDVVSVAPDRLAGERMAQHAVKYLRLHGVDAESRPIASEFDPADVIIEETRNANAGMLVMGAYGRRGWRERLLGSCTTRILDACPATLFVCQ